MTWGESAKEKAEPVRVEKAFPPIISKSQFRRVNKQMRSRAPKKAHPRRWGAPTCSADWSSASSASVPYQDRTPRAGSFPIMCASP